jgi:SSS family solute:Na+ symporter
MVPAAILILAAAALFAKNFYRPMISPGMTDDQVAKLAKILVIVITLIALYLAIYSATTLVHLLLLGYAGVTQFLPGVLFGLYWKRVNKAGVFTGLVTGISVVAYLVLTKQDPFYGINAGFFALCVNFVVTIAVSLMTKTEVNPFDDVPVPANEAKGSA